MLNTQEKTTKSRKFYKQELQVKKLSHKAVLPKRETFYAAGVDLHSAYYYKVLARGKTLVKTDLAISVPFGTYGRIAPRPELALNNHITIGAGVIDSDFRGNVCILIFNHSNFDFIIKTGDRIAQLICEKISYPIVKEVSHLSKTTRNTNGFESNGK